MTSEPAATPSKATASVSPASPGPAAAAAAPGAGTGPAGPGSGKAERGSGRGAYGNSPGAGDDWLDAARRRLFSVMKNPNVGRDHPAYGTVWLLITVARNGRVLDASVDQSSGIPYLDQSALQMAHDASPLPPLPDSIRGDQVTFRIPARYEPGFFERLFR
jgi:periplasmic protein TonB